MKISYLFPTKYQTMEHDNNPEEAFFGTVNRFVYITGHSKTDTRLHYVIYKVLVKLMILFFISCELWYMFTECETWLEVVDSINVSVINLMAIYRYWNMMNHQDVFLKLRKAMELPYFDISNDRRKKLFLFWIKINQDYIKLLLVLGHFTLLVWYIYPLIDEIEYNLCLKIRIPFSYHSPILYPIAYILVVVTFHLTASFVMINDLIIQTHLIHLICQFSILGDCFENVIGDIEADNGNSDEEFNARYLKRFNNLIDQHRILLRHTNELKSILSVPMMCQLLISGTLICFAGYQVTQAAHSGIAKFLMSLSYLGYNMFELLIFCRWSDEIKVQSERIRDAVYSCGWERGLACSEGMRGRVLFVIARATTPLVLTAGGMYQLSLEFYTKLLKASYTALTILLQVEKERLN